VRHRLSKNFIISSSSSRRRRRRRRRRRERARATVTGRREKGLFRRRWGFALEIKVELWNRKKKHAQNT